MAESDKDLEKVIDEHLKRLYDRYKNNTKVFNATHIGHIAVGIVFLFAILLPFLTLQIDNHKAALEMKELEEKLQQQDRMAGGLRKARAGLQTVFEAVQETPKPLQAYIHALEEEAATGVRAVDPSGAGAVGETDACGSPVDMDRWMECRLRAYIKDRFETYRDILRENVAEPLARIDVSTFDQWRSNLEEGIEELRQRIQEKVAKTPGFWRDFGESSPVYRFIAEKANEFWGANQFEAIGKQLEEETARLKTEVETLQKRLDENRKRSEALASRLKSIGSAFRRFGLQLETAILISPIVLALMFMVAAINLCESIRLRRSFQLLFQRKDAEKRYISDSEIALSAPLWVDPLDPASKQTVKLYILLLPLPIFLAALVVIFYCWTLPGTFPDLSGFDYGKYIVFYLLSAGCFPVGFRRVQQTVGDYLPLEEDR